MINIKKIANLLFIAAIAMDRAWGSIEEVARFYPEGPKPAGGVERRARTGYCRIWDHSSVYHDGLIYVDFTFAVKTAEPKGVISLLPPWSLNVSSDFTAEGIDSSSSIVHDLTFNSDLPYTMRGALWVSKNGTVYKYGGYHPQEGMPTVKNISRTAPPNGEIWELNTTTRNWTKAVQPSGEQFLGSRNGGVTSIPTEDKAFFLGGWSSNMTDGSLKDWTHEERLAHRSMLAWDIKGNEMSNISTSFQAVTLSSLVHVPVGKHGILVSLGGNQYTGSTFYNTLGRAGLKARDFDSVDIFDLEAGSWSLQATTGEIPPSRWGFCAVVGTAADNSSFNIFIHGGNSPNRSGGSFSDTYVLSLPSFQWFRVDNTNKVQRFGVTCHLVKNKMIMIGGRGVDQTDPQVNDKNLPGECDPNGIVNIFDVNTLKWDPNFKVSKLDNFKVNENITGGVGIGGGPTGGATKVDPEGGWASGGLREIFAKVVPRPQKSSSASPSGPSNVTSTARPSNASLSPAPAQGRLFSLGLLVIAVVIAL